MPPWKSLFSGNAREGQNRRLWKTLPTFAAITSVLSVILHDNGHLSTTDVTLEQYIETWHPQEFP